MSNFDRMTLSQRVTAVNFDIMRSSVFCRLAGHVTMGRSEVAKAMPTAATDGKNKFYGEAFIKDMTRKQLRSIALHENSHVALGHCIQYKALVDKWPRLSNIAQDYVINGMLEELDPQHQFFDWPTSVKPLLDPKYTGMSFPNVLRDLIKEMKEKHNIDVSSGEKNATLNGKPLGEAIKDLIEKAFGKPLDEHVRGKHTHAEEEKINSEVSDANQHGEAEARRRAAGKESGGRDVFGLAKERQTDYRAALANFLQEITAGDDDSRFCPPNRRMLASGFLMPTHFTESPGDLILACDTSGSMHGLYGTVFGEIVRLCKQMQPGSVRLLWWDSEVCGEQLFTPDKYDALATALQPKGGGGTVPSRVVDYIEDKKIKAKAIVWLTDGYLGCDTPATRMPAIWTVIDNDNFTATHGKTLRVRS